MIFQIMRRYVWAQSVEVLISDFVLALIPSLIVREEIIVTHLALTHHFFFIWSNVRTIAWPSYPLESAIWQVFLYL